MEVAKMKRRVLRHGRVEGFGLDLDWMNMSECIQFWLADQEQMHQLAVVGDQWRPIACLGIVNRQAHDGLRSLDTHAGRNWHWLIEPVVSVVAVFQVPPGFSKKQEERE